MLFLDRLLPAGPPLTALDAVAATQPWRDPPAGRPRVLVNMVATVDGRTAVGGRSGPIGGEADHEMFHALRTAVDAVLVGTGTLRAERYGRLVRRPERRAERARLGLAEDPIAVLVSRSGELPWDAPMFEAPEQTVVVAGPVRVPGHVRARVERIEGAGLGGVLAVLRERFGVRALLCEGGPTLNASLLAAGALDELFLTVGPVLAGGGEDALRVLHGPELDPPARLQLRWVLQHADEVLLRYGR